jgi:hypothetical protein
VIRLYANTMPFYIRDLSCLGVLTSAGGPGTHPIGTATVFSPCMIVPSEAL